MRWFGVVPATIALFRFRFIINGVHWQLWCHAWRIAGAVWLASALLFLLGSAIRMSEILINGALASR